MIVIRERLPGGPLVTIRPPESVVRGGLTLILPSHNEAPSLRRVVREWWDLRPPGLDLQILVVDDASSDDTPTILEELATEMPVRAVRNPVQLGYGGSLRVGILHTRTDWLALCDADGQYDPNDLPKLLSNISDENVLANGWRVQRADPFVRIAISIGFRGLLATFFRARIKDPTSALKVGRTEHFRDVAEKVRYMNGSFGNEFMIRWLRAGHSVMPVPVRHLPRQEGSSKIVSRGLVSRVSVQQLIALVRLWREFHRLDIPADAVPHPTTEQR